jgi:hypothetical protein
MLHNTSSSKIFGNEIDVCEYETSRKEIQNLIHDDLSSDKELESHKKKFKNQINELKKMLKEILNEKETKPIGLDGDVKESVESDKGSTTTTTTTTTTFNNTLTPFISSSPLSCHPSSSSNQSTPSHHHRLAATSIFADVLLCVGSELYRDKKLLEEEERLLNADITNCRKEVSVLFIYLLVYLSLCTFISIFGCGVSLYRFNCSFYPMIIMENDTG